MGEVQLSVKCACVTVGRVHGRVQSLACLLPTYYVGSGLKFFKIILF